jgi:hypothetical protein
MGVRHWIVRDSGVLKNTVATPRLTDYLTVSQVIREYYLHGYRCIRISVLKVT